MDIFWLQIMSDILLALMGLALLIGLKPKHHKNQHTPVNNLPHICGNGIRHSCKLQGFRKQNEK
jgi:hypothetical protein